MTQAYYAIGLNLHQPYGNLINLHNTVQWEAKQVLHALARPPRYVKQNGPEARLHVVFSGTLLMQLTDPGAREELETMLARMPIAETLPAYGRVFGDRVGRLWLEEYVVGTPTHTEWRVFSQDGLALFSVDLPTRFQPTDAGSGYLIGVLKSELDVEGVILAPLATSPD